MFPNDKALERLAGAILMEINGEWQVGRRYYSLDRMRKLTDPETALDTPPAPLRLEPVH